MDTKMLMNAGAVSKSNKPVQDNLQVRDFNVDGFDMDHLQIPTAADIDFQPYPQEDDCGGGVEEFFQNL
jgi:hypothetical protein